MRRAGGLATRGRGVRASGPKQGGGSGQRAWLQKQVVPAIERSGLEGGRGEGGGAGSQLGCHVSPRLRTLTHWGEPVRLLPAPASKARRRPRGVDRSSSSADPPQLQLLRPTAAPPVRVCSTSDGPDRRRRLVAKPAPARSPQWQLVLTKGFRFSLIEAAPEAPAASTHCRVGGWHCTLHAATHSSSTPLQPARLSSFLFVSLHFLLLLLLLLQPQRIKLGAPASAIIRRAAGLHLV